MGNIQIKDTDRTINEIRMELTVHLNRLSGYLTGIGIALKVDSNVIDTQQQSIEELKDLISELLIKYNEKGVGKK